MISLKIPQSGNQRLHVGTGLDERIDSFLTDIAVINGGNTRERLDIFVVSGQKLGVSRLDRLTDFGSLLQVLVELGVKFLDVFKTCLQDLVAAGAFFVGSLMLKRFWKATARRALKRLIELLYCLSLP